MTTRPRKPAPGTPAPGKLALPEVAEMKRRGDRIVMITAYDAPSGRLADEAGVDPDYVEVADFGGPTLLIAARVGSTRLIDNAPLGEGDAA